MVQKKSTDPVSATELPLLGERRERGDAAANRQRILDAARRLVTERGVQALTIQAVAEAAGVGKTTVFHRFGDRSGLTSALLDDYMREFQDAFLHGPAPLGPGAPPSERLEAFIVELVRCQADHLELALAAETAPGEALGPVYGVTLLHIETLISEINPQLDARILAGFLLSAIAPPVLTRMRDALRIDTQSLQDAARALLRGVVSQTGAPVASSLHE
jgi:AcrR family transcriptional regulator